LVTFKEGEAEGGAGGARGVEEDFTAAAREDGCAGCGCGFVFADVVVCWSGFVGELVGVSFLLDHAFTTGLGEDLGGVSVSTFSFFFSFSFSGCVVVVVVAVAVAVAVAVVVVAWVDFLVHALVGGAGAGEGAGAGVGAGVGVGVGADAGAGAGVATTSLAFTGSASTTFVTTIGARSIVDFWSDSFFLSPVVVEADEKAMGAATGAVAEAAAIGAGSSLTTMTLAGAVRFCKVMRFRSPAGAASGSSSRG